MTVVAERADRVLASALDWLQQNYGTFTFFAERDIVWTLQLKVRGLLQEAGLAVHVFNDYGILPGNRRSRSADLALVDDHGSVLVAAEFKYEPAHSRTDIPSSKFPVVFWGDDGVGKDVSRVREFVEKGAATVAHSLFIDEGGSFRHRSPHEGSCWVAWGGDVWVLRASTKGLAPSHGA